MKKLSILLVLTLLLSCLSLPVSLAEEPVTLFVLAGQSTTDAGIEDLIDAKLAEKYPHIKLEWECVDWGNDFSGKMALYMQSGMPDIMVGKAQDIATYQPLGLLAPLSGDYMNAVLDAAKSGVTVDGSVYGMTYNALYQGVYYNRKLFAEYNVAIPATIDELLAAAKTFADAGIVPFETHFVDTWSIGNILMQFAVNEIFRYDPTWGDTFRAGSASYAADPRWAVCYDRVRLIYDNTWQDEAFSIEQTEADARLVAGKAAMKVSGSWSIQNFLTADPDADFGIFPFPNEAGDAKLLFEPNMTWMKSATTKHSDAVDKVFEVLTDPGLATEIYNHTKTNGMLKDAAPTYPNPSQADIDAYAAKGMIIDVNLGNNQLKWGGFQDENAKDVAEWILGNATLEAALAAADARVANSAP